MKSSRTLFFLSVGLLTAFALWTALVCCADVQPIGPRGSAVGLSHLNQAFHAMTGVHFTLYDITDWLGLVPVAIGAGFAILGLVQWIRRKRLFKVDFNLLVLGGFYLVVTAAYLLFEEFVVNYRPVLINGYLEASYPSSTTLLVLCVIPTAHMQLQKRLTRRRMKTAVTVAAAVFMLFMVGGRLVSGVHWLSDIVGGGLLSAGLVTMYDAVCSLEPTRTKTA